MVSLDQPFVEYFEGTWVGTRVRGPRFKIEWWNCFSATLNGVARTNNETEAWHSAFSRRVGSSHPGFYTFVGHLCAEQGLTEFEVVQAEIQGHVNVPKRVYRDRQIRLKQIVESYGDLDNLRYLGIVALNIRY